MDASRVPRRPGSHQGERLSALEPETRRTICSYQTDHPMDGDSDSQETIHEGNVLYSCTYIQDIQDVQGLLYFFSIIIEKGDRSDIRAPEHLIQVKPPGPVWKPAG